MNKDTYETERTKAKTQLLKEFPKDYKPVIEIVDEIERLRNKLVTIYISLFYKNGERVNEFECSKIHTFITRYIDYLTDNNYECQYNFEFYWHSIIRRINATDMFHIPY